MRMTTRVIYFIQSPRRYKMKRFCSFFVVAVPISSERAFFRVFSRFYTYTCVRLPVHMCSSEHVIEKNVSNGRKKEE